MHLWRSFGYWMTQYRRTWRGTIVISVANPLLFLVGIGAGLGHLVDRNAPAQLGGVSYARVLRTRAARRRGDADRLHRGPGRVAMAAAWAGLLPRGDDRRRSSRREILGGHLLFMAFRVLSSSAAFVAVMAAFGVLGRLVGAGRAGRRAPDRDRVRRAGRGVGRGVRFPRKINTVFRFVIMPMYMFSGTFFAITQLPHWLRGGGVRAPAVAGRRAVPHAQPRHRDALGGTAFHVAYLLVLTAAASSSPASPTGGGCTREQPRRAPGRRSPAGSVGRAR